MEEEERRREAEEEDEEKRSKRKQKREEWYKQYYKTISYREMYEDYHIGEIENCPLQKRERRGTFYANVKYDCSECKHFRGLKEDGKSLVCLFDYHSRKEQNDS